MVKGRDSDDYMLAKFRLDRGRLPYTDKEIASKMGIDAGNYSRIVNGKKAVTAGFVMKFYAAYGDELPGRKVEEGRGSSLPFELEEIHAELYCLLTSIHGTIFRLTQLSKRANFLITEIDDRNDGAGSTKFLETFGYGSDSRAAL